ncbi:MAG TPA: 2-phospho-L-lactate guanylyltransferase [Anaerolineae bacterium]|nr:2-phospho-L-lactate guanylyltransferase [Anaerolineae bacterium]
MSISTWVLLPVKPFNLSKSRLKPILSPNERRRLAQQLLHQTLALLTTIPLIDQILLITRDPQALQLAQQYPIITYKEPATAGLNQALTLGQHHAHRAGAAAILVLPLDLPFATPTDITTILTPPPHPAPYITICPDQQFQGTNALLLHPSLPFNFHYGLNSYQAHQQEAQKHAYHINTVTLPNLQFDLDTPSHWQQYQHKAIKL